MDIVEAPYQVSLQVNGKGHFCGGSILNPEWILTTANCVKNFRKNSSSLTIRAGITFSDEDKGQLIRAKSVILHDRFNEALNDFDFGLIHLESRLDIVRRVKPIRIHNYAEDDLASCTNCLVSGWGDSEKPGATKNVLRGAYVAVINRAQCKTVYGDQITHRMACAGRLGQHTRNCNCPQLILSSEFQVYIYFDCHF